MNKLHFIIATFTIALFSCEKENSESDNNLVIKTGNICGWCAGGDSLTITQNETNYKFYSPCDDNDYQKKETTSEESWNDLLNTFNLNDFLEVDINTCYVCVDGCDQWIHIQKGAITHYVRFGFRDSVKIQTIRPLVDKLDSIRNVFRN